MSVSIRIARAAAITSGGPTQDFVVGGWGMAAVDIKAAILIVTNATADGVRADGASMSIAFVDAAGSTFLMTNNSADGSTTTNCGRRTSITDCICMLDTTVGVLTPPATPAVDARAQWNSFIQNGIRINWSDFPTAAVLVTCIFFAGTDVSAKVGQFGSPLLLDGTTTVSGLAFAPELVFSIGSRSLNHDVTDDGGAIVRQMMGFAENTTLIAPYPSQPNQMSLRWASGDNSTIATDQAYASVPTSSGTKGYLVFDATRAIELTSFTADGFVATARIAGAAGAYWNGYLALKFNGQVARKIFVESKGWAIAPTPEVPIDFSVTTPGFKPQFVLQLTSPLLSQNLLSQVSPSAGNYSINAFTASESYTCSVSSDDAATVPAGATESYVSTDLRTRTDSANSNPPPSDPTIGPDYRIATFLSFDSTGWTKRYTRALGGSTATQWPTLVIGAVPDVPVAGPIPAIQYDYRRRRTQ
jgi:hypothetical protein